MVSETMPDAQAVDHFAFSPELRSEYRRGCCGAASTMPDLDIVASDEGEESGEDGSLKATKFKRLNQQLMADSVFADLRMGMRANRPRRNQNSEVSRRLGRARQQRLSLQERVSEAELAVLDAQEALQDELAKLAAKDKEIESLEQELASSPTSSKEPPQPDLNDFNLEAKDNLANLMNKDRQLQVGAASTLPDLPVMTEGGIDEQDTPTLNDIRRPWPSTGTSLPELCDMHESPDAEDDGGDDAAEMRMCLRQAAKSLQASEHTEAKSEVQKNIEKTTSLLERDPMMNEISPNESPLFDPRHAWKMRQGRSVPPPRGQRPQFRRKRIGFGNP